VDKEHARFVLRSFRSGGADSRDPDFAEALKLANEDLELGQWLAGERAFDAAFTAALIMVPLPEPLREDILAHLAIERGDIPQAEDALDAAMIGALASLQPPSSLRVELVAAMMACSVAAGRPRGYWWRWATLPLAAAAGIALALFISFKQKAPQQMASFSPLPVAVLEHEFISAFESEGYTLDEKRADHVMLINHLKERKLPCPKTLPRGLVDVQGVGCRELVIDGKVGSIICFDLRDNGKVHLVIFRRQDVCGDLPPRSEPLLTNHGKWAVARWADEERVFVLLSESSDLHTLATLF
jgi:hypothetical protein